MAYIIKCSECGKMFKTEKKGNKYVTDYNDEIKDKCLSCGKKIEPVIMETEDWIANLVFKIKGER